MIEALRGVLCQLAEPVAVLRTILEQAVAADRRAARPVRRGRRARASSPIRVLHGFSPAQFEGDAGRFSRQLFQRVLESGAGRHARQRPRGRPGSPRRSSRCGPCDVAAILCVPIRAGGRIAALRPPRAPAAGLLPPTSTSALQPLLELAGPVLEALQAAAETDAASATGCATSETRLRGEAEESAPAARARDWSFGRFVGRSAGRARAGEPVPQGGGHRLPRARSGRDRHGQEHRRAHPPLRRPARAAPFVTVFCPSLERALVEAELFGHRRGRLHRRGDRPRRQGAGGRGRARSSSTRSASCRSRSSPSSCACCRSGPTSARRRRGAAADVRVIAATNRDLEPGGARRAASAATSTSGSTSSRCACRRCASAREDIPLLLRHCLDQTDAGRWIELAPDAARWLVELDFTWPGNVRHLEQLAARLTMEGAARPVSRRGPAPAARGARAPAGGAGPARTRAARRTSRPGLPHLLEESEKGWLEEALRRYPKLTRAAAGGEAQDQRVGALQEAPPVRDHGIGE